MSYSEEHNKKIDKIMALLIIIGIFSLFIAVIYSIDSIKQNNFIENEKEAYEVIRMLNGRKFEDIQNGEDTEQKIEVRQSLTFPTDKQVKIKKYSRDIFALSTVYYIENDNGIATVVAAKNLGVNILTNYATFKKESDQLNSDLPKLIDRINTEKFDSLESIFNPEYFGIGSDFDYDVTVYPSIQYPWDKQIKIRGKSRSSESAILYVENHNGIAKVIDIKQQ